MDFMLTERKALRGALAPARQIGAGYLLRTGGRFLRNPGPAALRRSPILNLWHGFGEREAIVDGSQRTSFADFVDQSLRLAGVLADQGLREGDSLAILAGNGTLWFQAMAATSLLGLRMPMINWHLSSAETAQCLSLANARALLVEGDFIKRVDKSVRAQVDVLLVSGGGRRPRGAVDLDAAMTSAPSDAPTGRFRYSPRLFSGGTTGTPKAIELDTAAVARRLLPGRRGLNPARLPGLLLKQVSLPGWLELGAIHDPQTQNIRSLIPGPLYHSGTQTAVLPFFLGATVVPMRKFDAEHFLHLIERERINWTFVAPTMLERVLALPEERRKRYDLSSMHTLLCGAAPCPAEVKRATNALFRECGNERDVFHEFYGSTEASVVSLLLPQDYRDHPHRYDSVGKVRCADCGILDDDTGEWAATGTDGKVMIRSPAVYALSYAGYSEQDMRRSFREIDGSLWYDDGVRGHLDADGFLYLTGRDKEMIITGGVNIFPNEIEDTLKRHPDVHDAAVVAGPDRDLGEVAHAFVQPAEGAADIDGEALLAFCREQGLYGFKMPRGITVTADLPRDISGKLRKKALTDSLWEK